MTPHRLWDESGGGGLIYGLRKSFGNSPRMPVETEEGVALFLLALVTRRLTQRLLTVRDGAPFLFLVEKPPIFVRARLFCRTLH